MISITHGQFSADIVPYIGGGVASFQFGALELFRPASVETLATGDRFGLGCFPLLPFPGRIRDGRFGDVTLAPTHPVSSYPLHGQGWLARWDLAGHQADSCWLRYRHKQDDWPWDYAANLLYRLSECGLTMLLSVRNLSDRPMPVGLGQHPYFPRRQGCRIATPLASVLWPADDLVADEIRPIPAEWGFAPDHKVGSVPLDHGFAGWSGAADLIWPEISLRITASAGGRFLQIYAPEGADYFCVEPMSSMPNAVNWKGSAEESGLRLLASGATASLECLFSVS
jgi:aldose 1-epimerase